MPAVAIRKLAASCARCGQTIPRGARFTWGKGGAFHAGTCPELSMPMPIPEPPEWPPRPTPTEPEPQPETPASAPKFAEPQLSPALHPEIEAEAHDATKLLRALEDAIAPTIGRYAKQAASTVDEPMVRRIVAEAMQEQRAPLTIDVRQPNGETVRIEGAHEQMPRLLDFCARRKHVYLYGPPGGGKSTAAAQVAKALGLTYGYIGLNPQTPDWKLLGFLSANGDYMETSFFQCYTRGGLFCIDELDNAAASLLTTLNGALENSHGAFPTGIFERHPDFVLVATGNTAGRGGDVLFPERRVFDAAFAERFRFMFWPYDEALEETLTLARNPHATCWLAWVRNCRAYCRREKIRVYFSPRASIQGAEDLAATKDSEIEIAKSVAFFGVSEDVQTRILNAHPLPKVPR